MPQLHELLHLTRNLHVFDLETTSLQIEEARIVEIAFQTHNHLGMLHEWRSLVNPGVPIHNAKAHGITDDDVTLKCWKCSKYKEEHPIPENTAQACNEWRAVPTFAALAKRLAAGFSDCDFAGKNIRYDLGVISAEFKRAGVKWSYAGARVIDGDRLEQILEPRTLSALYEKYTGKKLEGAHRADNDVRATTTVLQAQLERNRKLFPADLNLLHELQWPGWVDSEGKFRFDRDGVARVQFGKHRNVPMQQVPKDYWRWVSENFSDEVRQIAANALVGIFPTLEQK